MSIPLPRDKAEIGFNRLERGAYRKEVFVRLGFDMSVYEDFNKKWIQHTSNAVKRGIETTLTFRHYCLLAKAAGITDPRSIGRESGNYQLGRLGDVGPYSKSNCRFILVHENIREKMDNGGAARAGRKTSAKLKGRTVETHAGVALTTQKIRKAFVVYDPEGRKYEGSGLSPFCKEHGLLSSTLGQVLNGKRPHHKGWTGHWKSK